MAVTPTEVERYFQTARADRNNHLSRQGKEIECYLADIGQELLQARGRIRSHERHHASQFNVFDYIDPDENRISDILADLLNPAGTHGQGDTFLRLMLESLHLPMPSVTVPITVSREQATTLIANPLRRIDIVVDFGFFGIGIENKPWAAEQTDQVKDYLLQLNRRYGSHFLLLYLSGDGFPPPSVPVSELAQLEDMGQFRLWSYSSGFLAWIDACVDQCQADSVRWLLRHLGQYTRRFFTLELSDWRQDDHNAEQ